MRRRILIIGLALGLSACTALGSMACGGGEDPIDLESEGVGSDEDTPDYTVIATDFAFSEDHLDIASGDIVFELDNQGAAPHTLSLYRDEGYTDLAKTTGNVNPGINFEQPMSLNPGDYFVRCDVHPTQMEMTMTAKEVTSS